MTGNARANPGLAPAKQADGANFGGNAIRQHYFVAGKFEDSVAFSKLKSD